MVSRLVSAVGLIALVGLSSASIEASDWPEFRGPLGQGHSTEQGLPIEWSETHNVIWKTQVPGLGWSTPVIANGPDLGDDGNRGERRLASPACVQCRHRRPDA